MSISSSDYLTHPQSVYVQGLSQSLCDEIDARVNNAVSSVMLSYLELRVMLDQEVCRYTLVSIHH